MFNVEGSMLNGQRPHQRSTFNTQHSTFREEAFGTEGRDRTGDPQIHNLVL
jgi:hypothetical protein